jgi:hypothetical protein
MHREECIERFWCKNVVVRDSELPPYHEGFAAGNEKVKDATQNIHDPKFFMVSSCNPIMEFA